MTSGPPKLVTVSAACTHYPSAAINRYFFFLSLSPCMSAAAGGANINDIEFVFSHLFSIIMTQIVFVN